MSAVKHKHPAIDLIRLSEQWGSKEWHEMLVKAVRQKDLNKLSKTLYGIQRGMDQLVKDGLSDQRMRELFAYWTRQIEMAAKIIFRKKFPSVLDTGVQDFVNAADLNVKREHKNKKIRDEEFQKFLRGARY